MVISNNEPNNEYDKLGLKTTSVLIIISATILAPAKCLKIKFSFFIVQLDHRKIFTIELYEIMNVKLSE